MSDDDNENLDSENETTEEVDNTEEVEETAADAATEDLDKLRDSNKRLFERTKRAEAEAKLLKAERLKQEEKSKAQPSNNTDILSREETILIAQGMDLDILEEIKDYAKLKGIGLLKAKDTPFVQHLVEQKEAETKKERAKLSASKGSGTHQEKSMSDMSREDHMALAKEMADKIQ